jgi:hypothetical protein
MFLGDSAGKYQIIGLDPMKLQTLVSELERHVTPHGFYNWIIELIYYCVQRTER